MVPSAIGAGHRSRTSERVCRRRCARTCLTVAMPRRSTIAASVLFTGAGVLHFVRPAYFEAIVPDWFPDATLANRLSGAAEIALGLGLLPPRTRRWSALGLAAVAVVVFPANVDMAVNDVQVKPDGAGSVERSVGTASGTGRFVNWARLPLQVPLVWWLWREGRAASRDA